MSKSRCPPRLISTSNAVGVFKSNFSKGNLTYVHSKGTSKEYVIKRGGGTLFGTCGELRRDYAIWAILELCVQFRGTCDAEG